MKQNIAHADFPSHALNSHSDFLAKKRTGVSKIFGFMIILLVCFSGSKWHGTTPVLGSFLFFTGIFLMGAGTLGRIWCSIYIAGFKNKQLITEGPYSMSRNPLYLFSSIGAAGVGLGTETITIPIMILCAFAIYYPHVIKNEEEKLKRYHGLEYQAYLKRTPVFFPKLSFLKEPLTYGINPRNIKRDMMSAVWFIWSFGIMAFIVKLHQEGVIPILLNFY